SPFSAPNSQSHAKSTGQRRAYAISLAMGPRAVEDPQADRSLLHGKHSQSLLTQLARANAVSPLPGFSGRAWRGSLGEVIRGWRAASSRRAHSRENTEELPHCSRVIRPLPSWHEVLVRLKEQWG